MTTPASFSTETLTYPAPAHTHTPLSKSTAAVVTEQPTPAPKMSVGREPTVMRGDAARLRGGCIPCPDGGCCYIIPIPCCC
ncbi:hypothetical protein C8R43DRAFT_975821 [Mycena crocata]|nr:hypothetical protein C8R43DRAFT_975821 [Mycena crocata]